MKTIIGLLLIALFYFEYLSQPIVPSIKVIAPTEQSIKEGMKLEQRDMVYAFAARAAERIYRRNGCKSTFAVYTGRIAVDYKISPRVLAALVFIESSCNSNAVSGRRSVGLTQVNPLVWKASKAELQDPRRNLEIGASILAEYIRRYGLKEGLHAYNGFGNKSDEYSAKVLEAAGL